MTKRFNAQREAFSGCISLRGIVDHLDNKRAGMTFINLCTLDPGEAVRPFLELEESEAQNLIDTLWQAGLRPSDGTGSAGQLAATQAHLEAMQDIAIGLLRRDGVEL